MEIVQELGLAEVEEEEEQETRKSFSSPRDLCSQGVAKDLLVVEQEEEESSP